MPVCRVCLKERDPSKDRLENGGLCRGCKVHGKERRSLVKRYGLLPEEYSKLVEASEDACWICGGQDEVRLCIDHSHREPQVVRGLLCRRCNKGLGLFLDDPVLLKAAARYLEDPPATKVLGRSAVVKRT